MSGSGGASATSASVLWQAELEVALTLPSCYCETRALHDSAATPPCFAIARGPPFEVHRAPAELKACEGTPTRSPAGHLSWQMCGQGHVGCRSR